MSKLTKYSPHAPVRHFGFEPVEKIFDEVFNSLVPYDLIKVFGVTPFKDSSYPKVNVVDYEDRVEIEAELAGYTKDNIGLEVVDGILTLTGEKSTKSESGDEKKYLYRELRRSQFSRSFTLGDQLNHKDIEARFKEGLLYITIPKLSKSEPQKKQKVEIK